MQLTHSPSTRIPSLHARPFRSLVILPLIHRCIPLLRTTGLLQASSLESPQPFSSVHPILLALLLRSGSLRLDENFRFFRGQPSQPPPPPFFPLFADRYIACRPVRRYHTVHPRSTHIPHPWHGVPTARDNNRTDLVVFYRTEGERWPYIVSFFERFQTHRSSTTTHPVLVTCRCDATRSLSPRFFPG